MSDVVARPAKWQRRIAIADALLGFVRLGRFQPSAGEVAKVAEVSSAQLARLFGSTTAVGTYLARRRAREVVDAIGLSPAARAALGEQDEKAIAYAVLSGRKLEADDQ